MTEYILAKEVNATALLDIYNYYISNTTATFDYDPINMAEFRRRVPFGQDRYKTYMVYDDNQLAGFCFLAEYRNKPAYCKTAEMGVYLKRGFTGKGLGKKSAKFLENVAKENEFSMIVASTSGENTHSANLFKSMGYGQCACYREIAEKFGRKMDIIDFQKRLD